MSDVDQLLSLIGTHNKLLRDVIEYVERTEADRDEAREEYARLYDRFDLVIEILELKFPKRPEWRKGETQ